MNPTQEYWYEEVHERIGPVITRSTCRPATDDEIWHCKTLHAAGNCPHTIIEDERGWLYDFRSCAICGKSLGAV